MHQYSSTLRSLTKGRARFDLFFAEYAPVSYETQRKLSEAHMKHEEELVLA
ncbi:MAG: hypothetical protein ACOVNR_10870 [Chitinophagaceae bacterium]